MKRPKKPPPSAFIPYFDGDLDLPTLHEVDEDTVQPNGTSVFEHPITNQWIYADLNLPQGEEMNQLKVICQSRDDNQNIIGKYDSNPMLNTMVYDVEFSDGYIREHRANVIANNMYS